MLVMCTACGAHQATTPDNLCAGCANTRRNAILPLAAAVSATVVMLGASVLAERLTRRLRHQPPALATFARDLTAAAQAGQLDPVVGRDEEIERMIAILARRSKNNPVLLGEPGVGKTAMVEGLANRIASGQVPAALLNKRVLALNIASLVAGTKYRGEFESRVRRLLDEVRLAAREIILFIDELHLLVGAGGAEGAMDLSSMLKPELARGELQCIGATTFEEYRRYIEVDAALERRFQPLMIAEPSLAASVAILRALRERYSQHHRVNIDDAAIEAAVSLSARYVTNRNLPDKAIDVMDEAASAAALRGESTVTVDAVTTVIAKWTGIPANQLSQRHNQDLLTLESALAERIIGQPAALTRIAESIRRSRTGLKDPQKPVGSFFFCGPSGVGKTETARMLASVLFGTSTAFVRVDLSEYTESHAVSRLIGAPPGYAGHDDPGQLREPLRRHPYSVVLFDNLEQAHHDVAALLLQILDQGQLTDSKGRIINFRHAIVIFTATLSASALKRAIRGEWLERIDDLIEFQPLTQATGEAIVAAEVRALQERVAARGVTLILTPAASAIIAAQSLKTGQGARAISQTIAHAITTPLSNTLLAQQLPTHSRIIIEAQPHTESEGSDTKNMIRLSIQ